MRSDNLPGLIRKEVQVGARGAQKVRYRRVSRILCAENNTIEEFICKNRQATSRG